MNFCKHGVILCLVLASLGAGPADRPRVPGVVRPNDAVRADAVEPPAAAEPSGWMPTADDFKSVKNFALIGLLSLAPAALLMFTSYVRINLVLVLLRQALGSPQIPGNQVLAALSLLLTVLVMRPVGEAVYDRALAPFAEKRITAIQAWDEGSRPVKAFLCDQIVRTGHVDYLWDLYDFAEPPREGRFTPKYADEFPLRVVAPAFLLSELTTALMIGFAIYLPFLVIDLVVSAVLSAMGLFMLPPSLVALPLKLALFVLADGWMLVASSLLRTFATAN